MAFVRKLTLAKRKISVVKGVSEKLLFNNMPHVMHDDKKIILDKYAHFKRLLNMTRQPQ